MIRHLAHVAAGACDGINLLIENRRSIIGDLLELATIGAFLMLIAVLALAVGGEA